MFAQHQPLISRSFEHPSGLLRGGHFVLASIRAQFPSVVEYCRRRNIENGPLAHRCFFGFKVLAYDLLEEELAVRYNRLEKAISRSDEDALAEVLTWHGFGLAKGALLIQMWSGRLACVDSRNVEYYSLPMGVVRNPWPLNTRNIARAVDKYLAVLAELPPSDEMWNAWCRYYAAQSEGWHFNHDPVKVSAAHCLALGLDSDATAEDDIPF